MVINAQFDYFGWFKSLCRPVDIWSYEVFMLGVRLYGGFKPPKPPLEVCGYYHLLAPILVSAGCCEARLTAPQ